MLGKISYLQEKFTWRGWTFSEYIKISKYQAVCDSQPHKCPPVTIPDSWYSQTCIVSCHIVPGLDFVAYSVWQKWCCITSDIKLYKTVASLVFSLSEFTYSGQKPSHGQAYGEAHTAKNWDVLPILTWVWLSVNTLVPLESASLVITWPLPYGRAWARTTQLCSSQIPDAQKLCAIINVLSCSMLE